MVQSLLWPDAALAKPPRKKRVRKAKPRPSLRVAMGRRDGRYPAIMVGCAVYSASGGVSPNAWVFLVCKTPEQLAQAVRDKARLQKRAGYRHVIIETIPQG